MNYALFILLLALTGQTHYDGKFFDTLAECQEEKARIPERIANYNASAENPVKIIGYATTCEPVKSAPQGKAI